MTVLRILCVLINIGVGVDGVLCYWCSGVGADRECERHPYAVRTGPIYINCRSRFCITAKVTDAHTGEVQSFARLCDNIPHGNQCVRDARLLTCYETCTHDLCNSGNPGPHYLKMVNYASSSSDTANNNNATNFRSYQGTRNNNGTNKESERTNISRVENVTFVNDLRLEGQKQDNFVRNDRILDDNEDDLDVRNRHLNMKEKSGSRWVLADYLGSQGHSTVLGDGESRAVVPGASQDERGPTPPHEGEANHQLSNYFSSLNKELPLLSPFYDDNKDEASRGLSRAAETRIPASAKSVLPFSSLRAQGKNLDAVLDFQKSDFLTDKGKKGFLVLSKESGTLKENLYKLNKLNKHSFEEGEEWILNPSERPAPLFRSYSIGRELAPMVMDRHPSAYLSSQRLQDKAQTPRDVVVGGSSASSRNSPDSYPLATTRDPLPFSSKKHGRNFQSKSDHFYSPSFIGPGTGNENLSLFKTHSTPPSYSAQLSRNPAFRPSSSPRIYSGGKIPPLFRVPTPVLQSRPTILLATALEQSSASAVLMDPPPAVLLGPSTKAGYRQHPSPIQASYSRMPWHQQVPAKKNSSTNHHATQNPKFSPPFPVLVSSHNESSSPSPAGVAPPKIDSYSVFRNKLRERDFRFVPEEESQGSDLWEPHDLTSDAAYIETGYKMDSLDDIVSAYRQHPGNRYASSQPVFYAPPTSQTTEISSFEEAKRTMPFSLKKLGQSDVSSPTTVNDQLVPLSTVNDDERSLSSTLASDQSLLTVVENDEERDLSGAITAQGMRMQTVNMDKQSEALDEVLSLSSTEKDHQSLPSIAVIDKVLSLSTAKKDQQSFLSTTPTNQVLSLPTSKNDGKSFSLTAPTNQVVSLSTSTNDQRSLWLNPSTDHIMSSLITTIPTRLLAKDSPHGTATQGLPQEKNMKPERLHSSSATPEALKVSNNSWAQFRNIAQNTSENANISSTALDFSLNLTREDATTTSSAISQLHTNRMFSFIPVTINNSVYANTSNNLKGKERFPTLETSKSSGRHNTNGIIQTGVNKTSENAPVNTSQISYEVANKSIQTVSEAATSSAQTVSTKTVIRVGWSVSSTASQDVPLNKTLTTKQYSNSVASRPEATRLGSFVTASATHVSQRQRQTGVEPSPNTSAAPYYRPTERRRLLPKSQELQNKRNGGGKFVWSRDSGSRNVGLGLPASEQDDPSERTLDSLAAESSTKTSTSAVGESGRVVELSREREYEDYSRTFASAPYVNRLTSEPLQKTLDTARTLTTYLGTTQSPLSQQTTLRFHAVPVGVSTAPVTSPVYTLTYPSPVRNASKLDVGKKQGRGMVFSSESQKRSRWGHVHTEAKGHNKSTRHSHPFASLVAVALMLVFSR